MMSKMNLYVMGCLFLLGACTDFGGNEPPLGHEEMVPLVYQLMLVDEISTDYHNRDSSLRVDSIRGKKYDQVFQMNKVDYESFRKSYDYYLERPDQLKRIFDSVEAFGNRDRLHRMAPYSSKPTGKPKKTPPSVKPE